MQNKVKNDVGVDQNTTNISQLERWKLSKERMQYISYVQSSMMQISKLLDHENFAVVSKRNGIAT